MIVIGITGATGCIYGIRLAEVLMENDYPVRIILSDSAIQVIQSEVLNIPTQSYEDFLKLAFPFISSDLIFKNNDFSIPFVSGSSEFESMVICPCSMATLGSIANGISDNTIRRTADVCIKEKKTLVIVPRETPLNSIHLENMLTLSRQNVTILPAMPGFYHYPREIKDLVDFIVDRILKQLSVKIRLIESYGEKH